MVNIIRQISGIIKKGFSLPNYYEPYIYRICALCFRVRHFGELAPECATTYYKYGCALFDKLQDEADPLGETVNPSNGLPPSHGEGSSGKGDIRFFLQLILLDTRESMNFTCVV